jgi:hypothetical protein
MTAVAGTILGALLWLLPFAAALTILLALVCALQRNWPRPPRWMRRKVPGRFPDGRPLTVPEKERFRWITEGYKQDAREPGRRS